MARLVTKPVAAKMSAARKAVVKSALATHAGQAASPTPVPKITPLSRKTAYATLVRRLAKDLGVKVAAAPASSPVNPYRTSSAATKKALQSVGVLTRSGNLSPRLK